MADDDIERLLREVDAMGGSGGGAGQPPAKRTSKAPATQESTDSPGGFGDRVVSAAIAGAAIGAGTLVAGWFVPFVGGVQFGLGGFVGGTVAWLIAKRGK